MIDRRQFLGAISMPAGALLAMSHPTAPGLSWTQGILADLASDPRPATAVAGDESFWQEIQQAFTVDRTLINLNNGGVSPSPAFVQDAVKRHLDFSNTAPTWAMWRILEPRREVVRDRLARMFGCDSEEIALTRNASEGLQILQHAFDLEPGDQVLTTDQDYPRMVATFQQRERRHGIVLKQFPIPVPCEDPSEIVSAFEAAITDRTRLILMCHVINLTGQILPVKEVVRMARKRDIPVLVDGAHSFAHFPFTRDDLDCDFFATSLHKWLFAPHGTGMLYVRKERIPGIWPLTSAPEELDEDIRKFEEIGTHPAAPYLAIGEALTFHQGIGAERKAERLRFLRNYWAERLRETGKVRLHTSLRRDFSCGIATMEIEGIDPSDLNDHLWAKHRIITCTIDHDSFRGIRVTPSVYTTLEELDRFCDGVESVIEKGIPKA